MTSNNGACAPAHTHATRACTQKDQLFSRSTRKSMQAQHLVFLVKSALDCEIHAAADSPQQHSTNYFNVLRLHICTHKAYKLSEHLVLMNTEASHLMSYACHTKRRLGKQRCNATKVSHIVLIKTEASYLVPHARHKIQNAVMLCKNEVLV